MLGKFCSSSVGALQVENYEGSPIVALLGAIAAFLSISLRRVLKHLTFYRERSLAIIVSNWKEPI